MDAVKLGCIVARFELRMVCRFHGASGGARQAQRNVSTGSLYETKAEEERFFPVCTAEQPQKLNWLAWPMRWQ